MRQKQRIWLSSVAAGVLVVAVGSCVLFNDDGDDDDDDTVTLPDAGDAACPNPDFPTNCGEGDCWSPDTDCSFPVFECGDARWRCKTATDWAACCDGLFVTCPTGYPYYCPSDQQCYTESASCSGAVCDYRAAACAGS